MWINKATTGKILSHPILAFLINSSRNMFQCKMKVFMMICVPTATEVTCKSGQWDLSCFAVCTYRYTCSSSFCLPQKHHAAVGHCACYRNPCCPADPTRAADFRRPAQSNKSCHYRGDFLIPVLKTSYRLLSFGDLSKNYYIGEHGKRFRVCSLSLYYQPQLRPLYMLSW